jgi:hypothetical protein
MELVFDDIPEARPEPARAEPPRAAVAIQLARAKLTVAPKSRPIWPVIAAAFFAAVSALALAAAIIVGPPQF